MPIRPENRDRYPKDWPAISLDIRENRAQGRCECHGECGTGHDGEARSFMPDGAEDTEPKRCQAINRLPHPVTGSKVVLTVAHLDQTPEHCERSNLLAMCQRCHLKYDAPARLAGVKRRRANGRAAANARWNQEKNCTPPRAAPQLPEHLSLQ